MDDLELSGCAEDWDAMTGTLRQRHCARCDQVVVDLSEGTRAESQDVRQARPCLRIRRRPGGALVFRRGLVALAASSLAAAPAGAAVAGLPTVQAAPVADAAEEDRSLWVFQIGTWEHEDVGGTVRVRVGDAEVEVPIAPDGTVRVDPALLGLEAMPEDGVTELEVRVHGYEVIYWSGSAYGVHVALPPPEDTWIVMGVEIQSPGRRRIRPLTAIKRLFWR